ncbi:MAG TPA: rod-binding protein [Gemmatimonadales bacterium]|jgi:Rod binding domain-containing protein|nr:rod-binding protein [Gemmatimonadales bacterium]
MTSGIPPTATPAPGSPQARLLDAAHQLQSIFYSQLFQAMRDAEPEGGMLQQSTGEKMFTGMLDDKIAALASNQTDRGLADAMYRQLSRQIAPASAAAAPAAAAPATAVKP